EDDAIIQMSLKRMLQKYGYRVAGAVSEGQEAVRVIKETHPDAVLMDIHLKGNMSGLDVYRRIAPNLKGTSFIFLTAFSVDDLTECEILEHCYCLKKPYVEADIFDLLDEIFDHRPHHHREEDEIHSHVGH